MGGFAVALRANIVNFYRLLCVLKIRTDFYKNGPIPTTFSLFSLQLTENIQYKFLPMTGFEPRTSGVGSDRSTN